MRSLPQMIGARSGPPAVHVLARRQVRHPRHRHLQRDQVRPARLRLRPARGPARQRRRRLRGLPRLHPRRRHVRRGAKSSSPPASAPPAPRTSPAQSLSAIERNRAEVDVAPLTMRAGATFAGIAPELASRVARRFGSEGIAEIWSMASVPSAETAAGRRDAASSVARVRSTPRFLRPCLACPAPVSGARCRIRAMCLTHV